MNFDLKEIGIWIKDKVTWICQYWYLVVGVFIAVLVIIWLIKRLFVNIMSNER